MPERKPDGEIVQIVEDVFALSRELPFTPDGLAILRRLMAVDKP